MLNVELRYSSHPEDVKKYDTARLRSEFAIPNLMEPDRIHLVYALTDRFIVGGAMPVTQKLQLPTFDQLKADYFLERENWGSLM